MRTIDEELIWETYTENLPKINSNLKKYYPFAEWVPVDFLDSIKEFDRNKELGMSQFASFDELQNSIERKGIVEPVRIRYSIPDESVMMTEGNHRLIAAKNAGWTHLPAIIERSHYDFGEDRLHKSQKVTPYDREKNHPHMPSEFKPSLLGIESSPI